MMEHYSEIRRIRFINHSILGDLELDFCDEYGNAYDFIIIAGENGTGKSTILNSLYKVIMKYNEFKSHTYKRLRNEFGFQKEGKMYVYRNDEVKIIIDTQKSNYSNDSYVHVGINPKLKIMWIYLLMISILSDVDYYVENTMILRSLCYQDIWKNRIDIL